MARRELDPFTGFNFLLESDGVLQAGFSEVSGLDSESDVVEYREGNEDITVRKIPALKKFNKVTLKRGVSTGTQMFDWRKTVMDGNIERHDISIILLNELREEQVRYNLTAAWPSKWVGPELKASANEIAIEQLEISHEGVSLG